MVASQLGVVTEWQEAVAHVAGISLDLEGFHEVFTQVLLSNVTYSEVFQFTLEGYMKEAYRNPTNASL